MCRVRSVVGVALSFMVSACSPPLPRPLPGKTGIARDEVLRGGAFFIGETHVQTISRVRQDDAEPVASEVTVRVLDVGSVSIPVEVQSVTVGTTSKVVAAFTVPSGAFEVIVNWGPAVGTTTLTAFGARKIDATSDETITFVDRMDQCLTIMRAVDRTFCEQNGNVFVYGHDGALEQTIAGSEVRTLGSEVWISQLTGLSHFTETPSGLRFDATAQLELKNPFGETTPGVALRGTTTGLVKVTWDGTSLTSTPIAGFPSMFYGAGFYESRPDQITIVGSNTLCVIDRGCTTRVCDPLVSCSFPGATPGITRTHLWTLAEQSGAGRIARYRLRDLSRDPRPMLVPDFDASSDGFGIWSEPSLIARLPALDTIQGTLLFDADESGPWMSLWPHAGKTVAATEDWLIAGVSRFQLQFHKLR